MVRLDHIVQAWLRANAAPNASAKVAQKRIIAGEFALNGSVTCEPKQQVVPGVETVTLASNGEEVPIEEHSFFLLHKPVGCVCQRHPREPTVYDLIPSEHRRPDLVCVGRLDRDTTGALLFGTDGGLQSMLLHPTSRVYKVYVAECTGTLVPDAPERFRAGLVLEDGTQCAPATVEVVPADEKEPTSASDADGVSGGASAAPPPLTRVRVTLHEGFFHQVKRMLARCGVVVVGLHRERFGTLEAAGLAPGTMRALTASERAMLCDMLPLDRIAQREVGWERRGPSGSASGSAAPAEVETSSSTFDEVARKRPRTTSSTDPCAT